MISNISAMTAVVCTVALAACSQAKEAADTSDGAIAACEQTLLKRLKSPSTYKRVAAKFAAGSTFSFAEFKRYRGVGCTDETEGAYGRCMGDNMVLAYEGRERLNHRGIKRPTQRQRDAAIEASLRESYKRYQAQPETSRRPALVSLEYDAVNAFNAPIRGAIACQFGPRGRAVSFEAADIYAIVDMGT